MDRYWINHVDHNNVQVSTPCKHLTKEKALAEARRLAKLNSNIGMKVFTLGVANVTVARITTSVKEVLPLKEKKNVVKKSLNSKEKKNENKLTVRDKSKPPPGRRKNYPASGRGNVPAL